MTVSQTNWREIRLFAILGSLLSVGGYAGLVLTGETNILLLAAPALAAAGKIVGETSS